MSAEIRQGRWQDVLADVECDALIVDAPYSERTHVGMRVGRHGVPDRNGYPLVRKVVPYAMWTPDDVREFVAAWAPRTRGWFVSITDHLLGPVFCDALESAGRYTFPPLPFLELGKQPRLGGDGPASWTCWIVVARPRVRAMQSWGSLPGGYACSGVSHTERVIKGGKPLWLMRALVRDYSRPGDLVCDPCAGGGTTLLAARAEGRRGIGAEMDEAHYRLARARLARGFTPPLFVEQPAPMVQTALELTE